MTEHGNVTIRAYEPDDLEILTRIWLDASRVGHAFFGEDELIRQQQLVRDIYLPAAENWVGVMDGRVLGFIGLMGHFIGGLFVDPAAHGCGVGAALARHALDLKRSLELEVYAANDGALGFYRHLGFTETGRRPTDDEGRPLTVVSMRRSTVDR